MLSPDTFKLNIKKCGHCDLIRFINIKFQMLPNCTPESIFILKKNCAVKILVCTANLFEN